eukprot:scaffold289893_cov32-Tisochrysis_lutea.AAC.4
MAAHRAAGKGHVGVVTLRLWCGSTRLLILRKSPSFELRIQYLYPSLELVHVLWVSRRGCPCDRQAQLPNLRHRLCCRETLGRGDCTSVPR